MLLAHGGGRESVIPSQLSKHWLTYIHRENGDVRHMLYHRHLLHMVVVQFSVAKKNTRRNFSLRNTTGSSRERSCLVGCKSLDIYLLQIAFTNYCIKFRM